MTQMTGGTTKRTMTTRRRFVALAATMATGLGALLAGCGGSTMKAPGYLGDPTSGNAPTDATRARVQQLGSQSASALMRSGAPFALMFASGGDAAVGAPAAPGGAAGFAGVFPPNLGAFMGNIANQPPARSSRAIRAMKAGRSGRASRQSMEPAPLDPPVGGEPQLPQPTFYFDEYLGLYVQTEYTPTEFKYRLYEDEAKTKPAGSITTTQPDDWNTFPQTYGSRYEFSAGYLKGAHGFYESTLNEDFSGRTRYENVYADGSKNAGRSTSTSAGDFTYFDRTDEADGFWTESSGTFRANGSGGTRTSSSDGFSTDFTFNPDGSGRGTMKGPLPGLPATITWDRNGNTSVRYADGSVERVDGWWGYGGSLEHFGETGEPGPVEDAAVTTTAAAR